MSSLNHCPFCGIKLCVNTCSGCGAETQPDWSFCAHCGESIEAASSTPDEPFAPSPPPAAPSPPPAKSPGASYWDDATPLSLTFAPDLFAWMDKQAFSKKQGKSRWLDGWLKEQLQREDLPDPVRVSRGSKGHRKRRSFSLHPDTWRGVAERAGCYGATGLVRALVLEGMANG